MGMIGTPVTAPSAAGSNTLSELRQILVEQSGMTGLVSDAEAADYTDKSGLRSNATYYLNAGLRWLNRLWGVGGTYKMYETTLAEGDYLLTVPNLDFAKRIWLTDSENKVCPLRHVTVEWLKKRYGEEWASVAAGKPRYWALAGFGRQNAFTQTAQGLQTVSAVTYTLRSDYPTHDGWEYEFSMTFSVDFDGDYASTFVRLTRDEAGTDVLATISTASVASDAETTYTGTFTGNGERVWLHIVSANLGGTDTPPEWTFIDINMDSPEADADIITMPPSDADYTVKIYGDFKTSNLVNDADTNWWTENHPELVVRAARISLELDGHRNVSGLTAFQQKAEDDVARLAAEHRFANISGYTPSEAARNG